MKRQLLTRIQRQILFPKHAHVTAVDMFYFDMLFLNLVRVLVYFVSMACVKYNFHHFIPSYNKTRQFMQITVPIKPLIFNKRRLYGLLRPNAQ